MVQVHFTLDFEGLRDQVMQIAEKSTWHQGSHNCFINTKLSPSLAMLNHAPKLTHVLEIHPLEQNC